MIDVDVVITQFGTGSQPQHKSSPDEAIEVDASVLFAPLTVNSR
jgi:hypothetical protein